MTFCLFMSNITKAFPQASIKIGENSVKIRNLFLPGNYVKSERWKLISNACNKFII